MRIFREGGNLKLDNNDFILKIVAELEQKGIKTGFDKLKKELEKDPAKIDVILDTSGTVGKTKGSIKKLAAELHNELSVEISKLQKQGQDINFDLSVGDVEEVIQNVINHTKKLGESFDVASDKAQKFLAKFNKKSGGVLINSDEFKAVQEAINGLGNTHTIEDLNKAMNTLEVTYDNMSSKLRNSGKSLNPFINAKNEMSTMDKTIEGISLEFDKLSSKPDNVANAIKELSVQQDMVNSFTIGTMEWADAYGHLQQMIVNVTKDISNLQKAQSSKSLQPRIDEIQLSMGDGTYESKVDALVAKTMQWTDVNGNARISTNELSKAFDQLTTASNNYANSPTEAHQKALIASEKELDKQIKTVTNSVRSMNAELAKDSKVSSLHNQLADFMSKNGKTVKYFGNDLRDIFNQTGQGAKLTNQELAVLKQRFIDIQNTARNTGKLGKTFFQTIREGMSSFSYWASSTFLVMKVIQSIKGGIRSVIELDTALVDLRKTTTMTYGELEKFYYQANEVAKQMGVTTAEIINQASAWSRLGYSSAEAASKMAKYSSMFASISPGMNVDTATDGLVSVMKAFDIGNDNPDDVLDGIMSKINIIGNTAATSNAEIVNMLTRSSSAMKEANNTLEETIALETAAVEITRDDASVGTAFKTVAMRIRGYDEETGEFIGNVEELSGEIANLTKTASTPGGISLFTDDTKTEYKSTYQLLKEISEIYDQLSDKDQAGLLEALAGKRQGQIIAATINNFEAAEKAMDNMANSAGSAEKEMSVIMDSIDYKVNRLKETSTGVAQNLFKREDMKIVVDGFTSIMNVIDKLTSKLGLFGSIGLGTGIFAGVKNIGKCRMSVRISNHCYCFEYALHA